MSLKDIDLNKFVKETTKAIDTAEKKGKGGLLGIAKSPMVQMMAKKNSCKSKSADCFGSRFFNNRNSFYRLLFFTTDAQYNWIAKLFCGACGCIADLECNNVFIQKIEDKKITHP